jgi:WS/DGAT/MGAT family acyltransferase
MADRLSALDVSFLHLESPTTPMHVGGVAIFQPPETGFDYETLVTLISERISLVPRYRQKVRWVPASLGNPVWVDDNDFDLTYHVRRSALPKPGNEAQLKDLVARVQSRGLDRKRPLWEIYLVEGLEGGRVAIMTKTHHAMVDGVSAVDIGQVILDVTPKPRDTPSDDWRARREPTSPELIVGVLPRHRWSTASARRSAARAGWPPAWPAPRSAYSPQSAAPPDRHPRRRST